MENKSTNQNESTSFQTLDITAVMLTIFLMLGGFLYWRSINNIPPEVQSFLASFPETYSEPLLIKQADFALSIAPLGALPAQAVKEGNVVKYVNAFPNTDIVQTKSFNKIKEDIILKTPGHPDIFKYQIDVSLYDFAKDKEGNLVFYQKGHKSDMNFWKFNIPAPFLIDADGKKSGTEAVSFELDENGRLTLTPNATWLSQAKYPVVLDPTVEINVINVHSHPLQGQNWVVDFVTSGTTDLKIIPNDQSTIDDDVFVSLSCDGQILQPQILPGDIIYYPNWSCSGTSEVIHYTEKAGTHTLRFEFGGQVSYAYNSPDPSIIVRSGGGAIFRAGGGTVFRIPPTPPPAVEYLVVAGGGGSDVSGPTSCYSSSSYASCNPAAGGGGGGGVLSGSVAVSVGTSNTVTVGGGAANNQNGGNSVFKSITAIGGGKGGGGYGGVVGGSGGGGGSMNTPGAGTAGQGYSGGNSFYTYMPYQSMYCFAGGGGGGAGGAGVSGSGGSDAYIMGGDGGPGIASSITGTPVYYGGGGGATFKCSYFAGYAGAGGSGGGGAYNQSGTVNTGGGAGGMSTTSGGSGIVIIRYSDFYNAAVSTTGSPTYSVSAGYKVYKWTTVGGGSITF